MYDLSLLETAFRKYSRNLTKWAPEGIVDINVEELNSLGLMDYESGKLKTDESLTRYFHVVESPEKITLINKEFVVWIVPENEGGVVSTYTLIAINNKENMPELELVYCTKGVYNTSFLVLRILEKYLQNIQENEETLRSLRFPDHL